MRGADSPRSASPIGPAPTRLPRIALPLPTENSFDGQHAPARGNGKDTARRDVPRGWARDRRGREKRGLERGWKGRG
ncbi:hypothetical protein GCM10023224_41500 [Streptomonospora halophila]|uniref:Uncharacterized protein n=1 Tax=Streptomonospora halophila TaxID=427369 RepID=A0ABP9GSQ1_9ACTN